MLLRGFVLRQSSYNMKFDKARLPKRSLSILSTRSQQLTAFQKGMKCHMYATC